MPSSASKLGLVLPAGGARAAYQVGVLREIALRYPEFAPKIFCGISAGSINAAFLAQGEPIQQACDHLYELWQKLQFTEVMRTNFSSLFQMFARWGYDLFLSKVTRRLKLNSLLDASPLGQTLLSHIRFSRISRSIENGTIIGLAVTATNYHTGMCTIFFETNQDTPEWRREGRMGNRAFIRARHIMASCSIPILFEPVHIGDSLYGDGSLRFNYPFSPCIHMGATHVLAVGIRAPIPVIPRVETKPASHLSMGFIAGAVLNSIFLDSLETDYEHLVRLNQETGSGGSLRNVKALLIRPSTDLGMMAKDYLHEVPFHFRQLLKSVANPEELGDLLSYLMFSPGYINALLELGKKDAAAQEDAIKEFVKTL
ncbi:MAG: patatin-like phospholipase family protein [Deltaproteobacteria bacterium]|nr:patatin-like phospholipase family protein [Deltaproteobacteria bacterium]MBI3296027.1 patatin-like phospholipase family protein [Deltaproteobacteria bacterium]